mmetsp:Transcript_44044/g.87386  ORF Transcript_44044/g.87386 Transcript_44044/m.87386 type:complete len:100 (-) Transcript_44044:1881-2180(-)
MAACYDDGKGHHHQREILGDHNHRGMAACYDDGDHNDDICVIRRMYFRAYDLSSSLGGFGYLQSSWQRERHRVFNAGLRGQTILPFGPQRVQLHASGKK